MNLANRITVARIAIVPIFVLCLSMDGVWAQSSAMFIFFLGAVSDTLDGWVARRRGEETNFGRIMDPLADKLLVVAALIILVDKSVIPGIPVLLIISRELAISGLRILAAAQGVVIPASPAGKSKTATQVIAISSGLVALWLRSTHQLDMFLGSSLLWLGVILPVWTAWLAAVFSVYSGTQYVVRNWSLLDRASKS